jgi:hypothetical protein
MSDADPLAHNISHHGELALLTPRQMEVADHAAEATERALNKPYRHQL